MTKDEQIPLDFTNYNIESDSDTPKEDTGSRITPSSLESIIHYHYQYKRLQQEEKLTPEELETQFTQLLNDYKPFKEEKVLKNAKDSIRGTHLHNLSYTLSLFQRTSSLNQLPHLEDFRTTFPFRKENYYTGLMKILEMTLNDFPSQDPLDNAQNFWNLWRLNGQNFLPNGKRYRVNAQQIKRLWEGDLVSLDTISLMKENFQEKYKELDPRESIVMNEVPITLNTYFEDNNIQICTNIDEIQINPSKSPSIHIIDYKTGKSFKNPGYEEELQIFLMTLAVYIKFVDEIPTLGVEINNWDILHKNGDLNKALGFKNKRTLSKGKNIKSVEHWQIPTLPFEQFIRFSYVNPVTQEEIPVDLKKVGLSEEKDIQKKLRILDFYHNFYLRYKHKGMRNKINGSVGFFTLPKFPSEEFIKKDIGLWDNTTTF